MKAEDRQELISEYAYECNIWESDVIDALYQAINEAIDEADVPDDYKDEVFDYINNQCIIKVFR